MKETVKIVQKLKTRGRFQVEIPTNGYMNRVDMKWAQKANPEAHAAHIYREQLDIKMLQKKRSSKKASLSTNYWPETNASVKPKSIMINKYQMKHIHTLT